MQAASFNPYILDTIYRAILLGKRLNIHYQRGSQIKEYELHPYGVVIMLPKLYLVAKKDDIHLEDESFRSFLVHKIQDIVVSQQSNSVSDDFDLRQYLDDGHMDVFLSYEDKESHKLKLEINAALNSNLIEDLTENPLSPDQVIAKLNDDTWHLSATVKRTIQLKKLANGTWQSGKSASSSSHSTRPLNSS